MESSIIFSASILAAFLAGIVALFAPCCVTVLLPAYLASVLRERTKILKMTVLFFVGVSTVLVPIGLGAAWLARTFQSFHKELYVFGGILMIIFAAMSLFGKGFSLIPLPQKMTAGLNPRSPKSVFALGVFSGAATSCCAPVLAGALTLAAITGAFWKALIVSFAYVFGITFPLFAAGFLYDKFRIEDWRAIRGRNLEIKFGEKVFSVHSTNALAAAVFFSVGAMLLVLAFSGNAFWSPAFQAEIGKVLQSWSETAFSALSGLRGIAAAAVIAALFFFFIYKSSRSHL